VSLVDSGGGWLQQFLAYFLLGLLLWVVFQNTTTHTEFLLRQTDQTNALGYALRTLPARQPTIVQVPTEGELSAASAAAALPLRFLTNDRVTTDESIRFVNTLPAEIAPGTVVLFFPQETATLETLRATYPAGTLQIQRDLLANPVVNLYTIPSAIE
jgi:hypothetical protein